MSSNASQPSLEEITTYASVSAVHPTPQVDQNIGREAFALVKVDRGF